LTFSQHNNEIRGVALSPDGRQIVSADSDGLVKVWDAQTGGVSAEFSDHVAPSGHRVIVFCVAWHPKGQLIASAGLDALRIWDARTNQRGLSLPAVGGKGLIYNPVA